MLIYLKCCFSENLVQRPVDIKHGKLHGGHANDLSPSYNAGILPENGKKSGDPN